MIRQIIKIDESKCNGCGLCAEACHEGAIAMVGGKAKLIRDDYCDGLGDCLPCCPTGAITFEQREALAYDEEAVAINMAKKAAETKAADAKTGQAKPHFGGCPGSNAHTINRPPAGGCPGSNAHAIKRPAAANEESAAAPAHEMESQLRQWPVQIKLVPVNAPYFNQAHLLIAADCTAYSYGDFHNRFMKNRVTIIGCPKLDEGDYSEKLTAILQQNDIKSVTLTRMEVPCCGGLANAAIKALKECGKMIPWQIVTITTDGQIIEN
ncbi:MAG: 4Fe-4S binding protein [Clostridiales bacterium]